MRSSSGPRSWPGSDRPAGRGPMGRIVVLVISARTRMLLTVVGLGLVLILSGCSEEEPTDYTSAHREAFLAACSRPLDDPRLLSDVCGCVYDRVEDEIRFDDFQQMSERLAVSTSGTVAGGTASTADSEPVPDSSTTTDDESEGGSGEGSDTTADSSDADGAGLPPEIAQLVADCFRSEADL